MSSQPTGGDDGTSDSQWEAMFRSMFGADADEALRQMREQGLDPQALARSAGLGDDPRALNGILAQVQRMLAASGDDPVNSDVAHDVARQVAAAEGDPTVSGAQAAAVRDALSVADLWLDAATDMPPAGGPRQAWSRSEWVEATLSSWGDLAEPIAASVTDALATVLGDQMPSTDDLSLPGLPVGALNGSFGDPQQMMRRMGSAVFGMQVGQASGRSPARSSAPRTSVSRSSTTPRRCCCPPTSRPSPRASTHRSTRSGCSSRCASARTRASSRTCRGSARTCSRSSTSTHAASRSTWARSRSGSATSTSRTPAPCRTR